VEGKSGAEGFVVSSFERLAMYFETVAKLRIDDNATRNRLALLLGLQQPATIEVTPVRQERDEPPQIVPELEPQQQPIAPAAETPQPPPRQKKRRRATKEELMLTPLPRRADERPAWLDVIRPLPPEPAEPRQPSPPEPLFAPRWTRALLSTAMARPSQTNTIDIDAVIRAIVRGEPLRQLPRRVVPSLARRVQLLIDRGAAMAPYALDQQLLADQIAAVAGRDGVQVLQLDPAAGFIAGTGRRRGWKDYFAEHRPLPGVTVVLLTDIGIAPVPIGEGAGPAEWLAFATRIRACGNRALAFVPYKPERWPAALSRVLRVVPWDRRTSVQSLRRILGRPVTS
jgi:hypothetical protein